MKDTKNYYSLSFYTFLWYDSKTWVLAVQLEEKSTLPHSLALFMIINNESKEFYRKQTTKNISSVLNASHVVIKVNHNNRKSNSK